MTEWIEDLARELGEEPLTEKEVQELLDVSRDVAHRVERKFTPLSTFLLGEAVARGIANGASRENALRESIDRLTGLLPPE